LLQPRYGLHRYLAEFDLRCNRRSKLGYTDAMPTDDALKSIGGKRLGGLVKPISPKQRARAFPRWRKSKGRA
jgi:hypothetical protein